MGEKVNFSVFRHLKNFAFLRHDVMSSDASVVTNSCEISHKKTQETFVFVIVALSTSGSQQKAFAYFLPSF